MLSRNNASVTSSWLKLVVDTANTLQLDEKSLLDQAGICKNYLADTNARIDISRVLEIWNLITEAINGKNLGLEIGRHITIKYLGSVGTSILSSKTIKDACSVLIHYEDLICDAITHKLEPCEEGYKVTFALDDMGFRGAEQIIDAMMSGMQVLIRWLSSSNMSPSNAHFKHSFYGPRNEYEAIFDCPVTFDCKENALFYSKADFEQLLPSENAMVRSLYQQINLHALNRLKRNQPLSQLNIKVRERLVIELPNGEPNVVDFSKHFNMSRRTFQRRLKEENWSFLRLLDDTRKMLATHYLGNGGLSLQETSFLLGFSNSGIFSRAFRRWYGSTPIKFVADNRSGNEIVLTKVTDIFTGISISY